MGSVAAAQAMALSSGVKYLIGQGKGANRRRKSAMTWSTGDRASKALSKGMGVLDLNGRALLPSQLKNSIAELQSSLVGDIHGRLRRFPKSD
jgi:hypothetical protein